MNKLIETHLFLGDHHIPFHDEVAVELSLKARRQGQLCYRGNDNLYVETVSKGSGSVALTGPIRLTRSLDRLQGEN